MVPRVSLAALNLRLIMPNFASTVLIKHKIFPFTSVNIIFPFSLSIVALLNSPCSSSFIAKIRQVEELLPMRVK